MVCSKSLMMNFEHDELLLIFHWEFEEKNQSCQLLSLYIKEVH
jgi:hypothetical protein